jgi:hypothetical protein
MSHSLLYDMSAATESVSGLLASVARNLQRTVGPPLCNDGPLLQLVARTTTSEDVA